MESPEPSIYERVGGEAAIMAAVGLFYDRIMADPSLAGYFEGMDMAKQIEKQIAFMTMAFGGPNEYTGRDLRAAHARLVRNRMGDVHFDAVVGHLVGALEELQVDRGLIDEIVDLVETTRADVLAGDASA